MDCPFCAIAQERAGSDRWVVFPDREPKAGTHLLVVPVRHIRDLAEMTPDEGAALGGFLGQVTRNYGLAGEYQLKVNGPRYQAVQHLHIHVLGPKRRPIVGIV